MISNRRTCLAYLSLLAVFTLLASLAATPAIGGARSVEDATCPFSTPGLVVEAVAPESTGFQAGFMPGDRLFSWCRTRGDKARCVARGAFRTPFDWRDVEIEEFQRGGVFVEGARGSKKLRWRLLAASQGLTVTPLLHGALAEAYQASRERRQAGDPASAGAELEQAAELAASENGCAEVELWLRAQAAHFRSEAKQWPEVDAGYQMALEKARAFKATRVEAHLHMGWWSAFWRRDEIIPAKQQLESALRIYEKNPSQSLSAALVFIRLSATVFRQEHLEETERFSRRAYDLARHAASGSGAEAAAANNLAAILATRGDLAQAELVLARTLAIQEKLAPAGEGIVKKILENIKPESQELATTLHLLGEIADRRGDRDAAESLFRRELVLLEKLDPDGSLMRERLMGLGKLALLQRQGDKAEELWQRALAISDKVNPKGPNSASCLIGLAEAMSLQGRSSEAEKLLQRALAIWQEINPEAIDTGSIHLKLGLLLLAQDDIEAAEAHFRTAIRIREKNQSVLPEGYQALARVQVRRGQVEEAAVSYLTAVDALEAQRSRLGGARESQWLYGSSLGDLYFEAAEHQIALGRPLEAWTFVERGRARGFQELLAQRDLRFAGELPAALYAERHRLTAKYDQTQAALADWVPEQGPEKIEELQGRLRDLRLEQAELQERILNTSPRIRSLERSTALDLATARAALDPGTVLLTYAIGESRSYLFVIEAADVSGPGLSFHPLAIGRENLEKEVESFRSLVGRPRTLLPALQERGRHLYDLLVRPAEPMIAKADRWLISPDGPLHSLPFAALVSGDRYLAESKPIHIAASAAVYKEIKAARAKQPAGSMLDFLGAGAPLYPGKLKNPAETAADPQVESALRRGLKLKSLPATRGEVEAISKLFPNTRTLLGRDATEEAIKSLAPQARRLHLATHGLLDERFPLNSSLALTVPETPTEGRDNGLLQAWEIFESLRLDADLVTLSACDTALGKEMGGEGLVGLTRAFQYAGARSVLASLWSISDVSTSRFMKSFYRHLRSGKPKDEALRAAQIEQIREKSGSSHPFHWAAFELFGDWR
jgi:CHAT domain-containing protein